MNDADRVRKALLELEGTISTSLEDLLAKVRDHWDRELTLTEERLLSGAYFAWQDAQRLNTVIP